MNHPRPMDDLDLSARAARAASIRVRDSFRRRSSARVRGAHERAQIADQILIARVMGRHVNRLLLERLKP